MLPPLPPLTPCTRLSSPQRRPLTLSATGSHTSGSFAKSEIVRPGWIKQFVESAIGCAVAAPISDGENITLALRSKIKQVPCQEASVSHGFPVIVVWTENIADC